MRYAVALIITLILGACSKDSPVAVEVIDPPAESAFVTLTRGHAMVLVEDLQVALDGAPGRIEVHAIRGYLFRSDGVVEFHRQIAPIDWEAASRTIIANPRRFLNYSEGKYELQEQECSPKGRSTVCGIVDLWDGAGSVISSRGVGYESTSYDYWFMTLRIHGPSGYVNVGDSTQDWRLVTEARFDSMLTIPMDLDH